MPTTKNTQVLLISTLALTLISCGGNSNSTTEPIYEIPELRITEINISSDNISYSDELEFDPDQTGLYELTVDSATQSMDISMSISEDAEKGSSSYIISSSGSTNTLELDDTLEFNIELEEGSNLLEVMLENETGLLPLSYSFNIYKAYSTAKLNNIELYEFPSTQSEETSVSPNFSSDTYDYLSTVPYDSCAVVAIPYANASATTIKHQDDELSSGGVLYQNLEVGRNYLDIYALSEDGKQERRYAIEIERSAPEDEQRSNNANLKTLEVSSGELNYICGFYAYAMTINSNVSSVNIDLSTEVEGAQVWLDGRQIDPDQTSAIEISTDSTSTIIQVVSTSGDTINSYQLTFARLARNYISVENITEFSEAFKNANPNDYIELAEGDYDLNELTLEELDEGSLRSDRSGSRLEPIIVAPADGAEVNLIGLSSSDNSSEDNYENSSVLKFTGNHWKIIDLNISNSDYGISLYNSENIDLSGLDFHDLNTGAVHSTAGIGNTVRLSHFEDIGDNLNPSYIIDITDNEEQFELLQNTFIVAPSNTAIRISEDSNDSTIESNLFTHTESLTELQKAIIIGGAENTTIKYNYFNFNIYSYSESLIQFPYAENENAVGNYIYENRITEIDSEIKFVDATFASTYIQLPDHTPDNTVLEGVKIYEEWDTPSFQIQLADSPQFCLGLYEYTELDEDIEFVSLKLCDDSDEQSWNIEIGDTAPYIQIKNLSATDDDDDTSYLTTLYNFNQYCSDDTYQASAYLDEYSEGTYIQRWLLDTSDDQTRIRSKSLFSYGLSAQGQIHIEDQALSVCPISSTDSQSFNFIQR